MAGRVESTHGTRFGGRFIVVVEQYIIAVVLLQLRAMKKKEERDQDVAWLKSLQEKEAALDEHDKKVLETARLVHLTDTVFKGMSIGKN